MLWLVVGSLFVMSAILMFAERKGAPLVLSMDLRGDLKRESRWLAQYGQGACSVVAAILIYLLDPRRFRHNAHPGVVLLAVVLVTSIICLLLKRLLGRVRPGRDDAGKFLGPTLRHQSWRESFPSSHSASAIAMSVVLAKLYPPAALLFWALALICASLRYLLDAHWPSDITFGIALGLAMGAIAIRVTGV